MIKRRLNLSLLFIVLLGFIIRVVDLTDNPAGFFADEASSGYNSYLLYKEGVVQDYYRSPVGLYAFLPFVVLFGVNEFAVRFTSVFFGVLSILVIYFWAKYLFNRSVGLLSAFFLAISPWHIHFSRIGFETSVFGFFTLLAVYLYTLSLKNIRLFSYFLPILFLGFLSYGVAFFQYPVIFFLGSIFIFLYNRGKKDLIFFKRDFYILSFIWAVVLLMLLHYIRVLGGFQRWDLLIINENILGVKEIVQGYLNHFSLDFLFLKGDIGFEGSFIKRHSIPGMGQLYLFQLPLIILGCIFLLLQRRKFKTGWEVLFFILLAYPLGSALFQKNPFASRSFVGVFPFTVLSALGFYYLFALFKGKYRKYVLILTGILIAVSFGHWLYLWKRYPLVSSGYWGWQYGFKKALLLLKKEENKYSELLITHRFNDSYTLLEFFNLQIDCRKCRIMNNPIEIDLKRKQLFALRKEDIEEAKDIYPSLRFRKYKLVLLPNDQPEIFIGYFEQEVN